MRHFEVPDLVDYRIVEAWWRGKVIDAIAARASFGFQFGHQRVQIDEGPVVLGGPGNVEQAGCERLPLGLVKRFRLEFEDGLAHGFSIFIVAHFRASGPDYRETRGQQLLFPETE